MALRLYLTPKVFNADPGVSAWVPKYFADGTILNGAWAGRDFDDWYLVEADLPQGDHDTVVANPDAFAFPVDLTQALTAGQVTAVQSKLEAANIPANWVTTSRTWTDVIRAVFGMMSLNQRFKGASDGAGMFQPGVTLNTTVSSLPIAVRQRLQGAADSLNLDSSGITGSSTLRDVYRTLGQQFLATPIRIGEIEV